MTKTSTKPHESTQELKHEVRRDIAQINFQQSRLDIHFRTCGEPNKPAIILLHPSPLSSNFMVPLLKVLGDSHYAIAWDAPGYGDSSKLNQTNNTLEPYIDSLALFMTSLSLNEAIIYGNATGAQIAIEFSKKYPEKCVKLVLENVAIFSDDERSVMLESYFPDLSPKENGEHLAQTWKVANKLFEYFPWYDESEIAKLSTPKPPINVIQATYVDYVKAGETYADAYIAAINNERSSQLQSIEIQTDIILWPDSIICRYCQRLNDVELPNNVVLHNAGSGMDSRIKHLLKLTLIETNKA